MMPPTQTRQTVLIVDDEDVVRWSVRLALEDVGYTVREARDGREGVADLYFSREPLVVVLDLRMPTITGADMLRVVAAEPELAARHTYIVLTAQPDALARLTQTDPQLADLNARLSIPVVAKPFEMEQLLAQVDVAAARLASA
jgi:CheY-like chemotaxis protein